MTCGTVSLQDTTGDGSVGLVGTTGTGSVSPRSCCGEGTPPPPPPPAGGTQFVRAFFDDAQNDFRWPGTVGDFGGWLPSSLTPPVTSGGGGDPTSSSSRIDVPYRPDDSVH